ncbi:SUMF1/EgtB/PvdO family nonheme iron enzyme [uncultured Desulfobacter sp.]|uniref:nSTAND1 domain-containing NTPase n=1 Tax=uncultured Desulfobacter sp. TaxID=240139 RepID=UPI002AA7E200|nr:SUMF1/EgtB/PvdO family nonheme iron enzyme [uncultured Desulfobacter sp.]
MSRDALVIGINTYSHLPDLKSPSEDAEAVAKLLEQYGGFNVTRLPAIKDKSNDAVRVGRKTAITLEQLENALVQLFTPAGRSVPDTALLLFSGHGLRKDFGSIQEGFLATSEASPDSGVRGLSMKWLRDLLIHSNVRQQVIWLDCCYSGELLNFDKADPGGRGKGRDRCFIAASREFESAYEQIGGDHGVLTGALLNALDPSQRPDGIVTNFTLTDFISRELKSKIQKPVFTSSGSPIILAQQNQHVEKKRPSADRVCPYRSLYYFDCNEQDPKFFFGRDGLTDRLIDMVRKSNFVAVLGPSGSGKSSLVRAGLLYQLRQGRKLSGSDAWPIYIFRPGKYPLKNLAEAFLDPVLSSLDPGRRGMRLSQAETLIEKGAKGFSQLIRGEKKTGRVILVADQFEEVFTLCRDAQERNRFFDCLFDALPLLEKDICLILTMRADFFSKCAEQGDTDLSELIQENLLTVPSMSSDELKNAIVEPAEKVGLEVEPELVNQMIGDVKHSPGSLPLLQYSLTELWNNREQDKLRLVEYTRMGGVKGTLAKRADQVYDDFSEQEQEISKRIFIQLTQLGEGSEDTRRQVAQQTLVKSPEESDNVRDVIQKLVDAKLIVTSELHAKDDTAVRSAVVDVAHEALIRHWPLLKKWLDENRDNIRFLRRLDDAAVYWEKNGRPQGLLWRCPDLDMLEKFHSKSAHDMSPNQVKFFNVSLREREKAANQKKKSKIILISLGLFALLSVFLFWCSYIRPTFFPNLEPFVSEIYDVRYVDKKQIEVCMPAIPIRKVFIGNKSVPFERVKDKKNRDAIRITLETERCFNEYDVNFYGWFDKKGVSRRVWVLYYPEEKWRQTGADLKAVFENQMVDVPGGAFDMGCSDEDGASNSNEKPVHKVHLSPYKIGKYEVTQKQWGKLMGYNPSNSSLGNGYPVESVSWYNAQEFIRRLNKLTGENYHLPTEAQWEYAARSGGKAEKYSGGNNPDNLAWHSGNSNGRTHLSGETAPNGLGLFDMSGNVYEWCRDWYDPKYYSDPGSSDKDTTGPLSRSYRVVRGGSFIFSAEICRSAYRLGYRPSDRYPDIGFRLVLLPGQRVSKQAEPGIESPQPSRDRSKAGPGGWGDSIPDGVPAGL